CAAPSKVIRPAEAIIVRAIQASAPTSIAHIVLVISGSTCALLCALITGWSEPVNAPARFALHVERVAWLEVRQWLGAGTRPRTVVLGRTANTGADVNLVAVLPGPARGVDVGGDRQATARVRRRCRSTTHSGCSYGAGAVDQIDQIAARFAERIRASAGGRQQRTVGSPADLPRDDHC